MMRNLPSLFAALIVCAAAYQTDVNADEFTIGFEWGETPDCNTGKPWRIDNPVFVLAGVPEGTATIKFEMRDLDAPGYRHGGGKVRYDGSDSVPAGAFTYKGPCPPRETHDYRWTATAFDAEGEELGKAAASRSFPE